MRTPWYNHFKNINWPRMWIVVATTAVVWSALAAVVPSAFHTPVMVVLSAVQSGFTFAMRSSKYLQREGQPPPIGVQP